MSIDVVYPWLKAAHVAAALVFLSGLLRLSIFLAASKVEESAVQIASSVRRWDGRITMPAMLLVWALGLTLAITGSWFTQPWLQLKLLVVIVLSGVHGVQSERLQRLSQGQVTGKNTSSYLVIAAMTVIAGLAVVKPF